MFINYKQYAKVPVVFLLSLALLVFAGCNWGTDDGTTNGDTETETKGELFISVTDAAADLESIEEVKLNINDVSIFSSTEGWISLNLKNNDFDLLSLKATGDSKLLVEDSLNAGAYSKIRVSLGAVEVDAEEESATADLIDENAVLASKEVELDANIAVAANGQTHVELDFIVDESLHIATNEDDEEVYVFLPVIEFSSTGNTTVNVDSSENVTTTGGGVDDSFKAGTNAQGNIRANFKLDEDSTIKVKNDGSLTLDLSTQTQLNTNTEAGTASDTNTNSGANLNLGGNTNVDVNGGLY